MPQDTNQANSSFSPSSLIGKRFGGFRDDMVKLGEDEPNYQTDGPTPDIQNSVKHQPAQDANNYDEYQKIIDTRSVDEIEAENEKLEEVSAPGQELKPNKELDTGEEPELEPPPVKKELNTPVKDLEIEAPAKLQTLEAPIESPEIKTPQVTRESAANGRAEVELSDKNNQAEDLGEKQPTYESEDSGLKPEIINQKSEIDNQTGRVGVTDNLEQEDTSPAYEVTTMPPKGKFKFKRLEWYWHIVKKPSLGLALFLAIIYSMRSFSADLPNTAWSFLDVLSLLFSIYVVFIIAWRVIRFRHENRSQAIVAGFCAGVSIGLVLAFFRMIYVFKFWTLINLVVEPIISGLIAGLMTGLISLIFKKKPYNS